MSVATIKPDVFLSSSSLDERTAELVNAALSEQGLDVFRPEKLPLDVNLREAVWEAIAESSAMVLILPAAGSVSANALVELGAAMAWHKPIFLMSLNPTPRHLPAFLAERMIYPIERLDDVIHSIKASMSPLADEGVARLKQIYQEMGVPTDQLLKNPAVLEQLARRYNSAGTPAASGEQLVFQLLRLRKQGKLPRLIAPRKGSH